MLRTLVLALCLLSTTCLSAQNFHAELGRACKAGDSVAVQKVLQSYQGKYPDNAQGGENLLWMGFSPAYYAINSQCAGCIRQMGTYEMLNVEERIEGKYPLVTWALRQRHPATVKALLEAGAEVEPAVKKDEYHPMYEALVIQKNAPAAFMLLNAGLDPTMQVTDKEKQTPLHYAAQMGHVPLIRFLVEKGADLEAMDKRGNTPIVYAMFFADHAAALQALIELGAETDITSNGKTLVQLAEKLQRTECLKLLRQSAAK